MQEQSNKKVSRIELLTRRVMDFYLKDFSVIYNFRPDWLKNIKTGKNLELDIYYPDLQLAIEVNGIAHQLKYQKEKDALKNKLCKDFGVFLITIEHNWDMISTIKKSIIGYCGDNKDIYKIKDTLRIPISKSLKKKIRSYKPSKKAFGNLAKRVKYKLEVEKRNINQKEETEGIRRRKLLREKYIKGN